MRTSLIPGYSLPHAEPWFVYYPGAWRPYHNRAWRTVVLVDGHLVVAATLEPCIVLVVSIGIKLKKWAARDVLASSGLKEMVVASPDDTLLFAIHTFTREFNPGEGHPVQQRPVELGVLCKPVRFWLLLSLPAFYYGLESRVDRKRSVAGRRLASRHACATFNGLPPSTGRRRKGERSVWRRRRTRGCCRRIRRRSPDIND